MSSDGCGRQRVGLCLIRGRSRFRWFERWPGAWVRELIAHMNDCNPSTRADIRHMICGGAYYRYAHNQYFDADSCRGKDYNPYSLAEENGKTEHPTNINIEKRGHRQNELNM
jgi:hypothetical protein